MLCGDLNVCISTDDIWNPKMLDTNFPSCTKDERQRVTTLMDEMKWVKELTGKSNIEALNEFGCMGQNTILAHAIWTDERETKIIKENRGKKETSTSLKITAVGGISSAAGFGAIDGFNQALKIA